MKEYTIGTVISGGWIITEEIGSGANGTVYRIEKNIGSVKTISALKVIRIPQSQNAIRQAYSEGMNEVSITSYFQGFVDEILKEVALMHQLKNHPNIVGYEDSDIIKHEEGIGWDILIRMELLTPLDMYLLHHNMDEKEVIQMGLDLTNALSYCHKKGIIHRDIKPANIFVTEKGTFKLGDFGIARTIEKTTGGLSKKGTESYMAPEVYLVRPYNESVDQYSLGMVLYSCMNNNRLPFLPPYPKPITFSNREDALAKRMRGEELPKPSEASDAFSKVILRACDYNSKRRYLDAEEFHNALDALIPKKVEETPPPVPKKKNDFKNIPAWAWYAAACVVCILGFFAINKVGDTSTEVNQNEVTEVSEHIDHSEVNSEHLIEETESTDEYYQRQFETIIKSFSEKEWYVNGMNWKTATLEEIGKSLEGDFIFEGSDNTVSEAVVFSDEAPSGYHYLRAEDFSKTGFIHASDHDVDGEWKISEVQWFAGSDACISTLNSHFPDVGFKMYDQQEEVLEAIGITDEMLEWVKESGVKSELYALTEYSLRWENDKKYSVCIHEYNDGDYMIEFGGCWMFFHSTGELFQFSI